MEAKAGTTGQPLAGLPSGVRGGSVDAGPVRGRWQAVESGAAENDGLRGDATGGTGQAGAVMDEQPQYQATDEQHEPERGLRCPDCGCGDLRVYYTRPLPDGRIRRVRLCRNCARKVMTTEKIT